MCTSLLLYRMQWPKTQDISRHMQLYCFTIQEALTMLCSALGQARKRREHERGSTKHEAHAIASNSFLNAQSN